MRCNLGSVDNPSDPPCARCRRESKHCYFNLTRKRALPSGGADSKAFISRNKRRKTIPSTSVAGPASDETVTGFRKEGIDVDESPEVGSPPDIESSELVRIDVSRSQQ